MYSPASIVRAILAALVVGALVMGTLMIWAIYSPTAPLPPLASISLDSIVQTAHFKIGVLAAAASFVFSLPSAGRYDSPGKIVQHSVHSVPATRSVLHKTKGTYWVIANVGRGVHKRIDENRELLELLHQEAPEFMESHPWVEGWIKSHDDFFCELEIASGAKNPLDQRASDTREYPRPWPVPAS